MILCCGEALIDMIPVTLPGGATGYEPLVGGAVFNTAVALGRLETPAGLLSGVSRDVFGVMLADHLSANGVDTSLLVRSDRLTTIAIVHMVSGNATYAFYDENSAGSGMAVSDLPALPDNVTTLYFGGISLVQEPGAEAYAALLAREGRDRLVMIDPNIRPGFIRDEQRYRERLDRMIAISDIVKVSDEDLHWIEPGEATLDAKVRALQARGPSLVIVTRGGDGATGYVRSRSLSVPAPVVEVVDTVGAGDTFNAGFLTGLSDGGYLEKTRIGGIDDDSLRHALDLAARVAAITVSRKGAAPPTAAEVGRGTRQ